MNEAKLPASVKTPLQFKVERRTTLQSFKLTVSLIQFHFNMQFFIDNHASLVVLHTCKPFSPREHITISTNTQLPLLYIILADSTEVRQILQLPSLTADVQNEIGLLMVAEEDNVSSRLRASSYETAGKLKTKMTS
jgi:hypothetical protein